VNYFNLGCSGATSVTRVAHLLLEAMKLEGVDLVYSGGDRGWVGDVPQVRLDCRKFESLGWKARMSSDEAVNLAISELLEGLVCKS
jgi:UDP-glucose 4-epimerase